MNSTEATSRVEVLRLARLLRVEPDRLDFLSSVDDHDLRAFRDQATDALFDAHAGTLKRLASAAKLLPAPVLAKIAEKAFGPLLCARVASEIEPGKATDVAKRLPVTFLTDLAIELDPRRSQRVISKIPRETIVAVAVELAGREDWLTLGRFVGFLPDESLRACLDAIDDVQVLRTAFAVDDVSAIATVIDLLTPDRLSALIEAASRERLWPTLLGIATQLRDDQVAAVAETVRRLAPEARADIAAQAEAIGVYDELGSIADALDDEAVA